MVDDPASEHYFDPNERFFTRRVFNSSETWPALPARRASGKLAGPATVRGGTVGQTAVDRVDSSQLPENVAF
jgi:hypothetical protein